MAEDKPKEALTSSSPSEPEKKDRRPNIKPAARSLAKHFVLMARAEAFDDLEREAGIQLVQEWMRSEEARALRGDRSCSAG